MTNARIIDEMDRAFIVLGFDKGEMQNSADLEAWEKQGLISKAQRAFMLALNRRCAKTRRLLFEIAD